MVRIYRRKAYPVADGSDNDHDLGPQVQVPELPTPVGLYPAVAHPGLADTRARLLRVPGGESDHGVSKSLYAKDPDSIEFEVMWAVSRADWPENVGTWRLDLPGALARWPHTDTAAEL